MKNRIILFDIDGTLFDPEKYLVSVFSQLADKMDIPKDIFFANAWSLFSRIKKKSVFTPHLFAKEISKIYKKDEKFIEKIFWEKSFFKNALYPDVIIALEKLVKVAKIGILSTGDETFQKAKIASIQHALSSDLLHIFSAKEKKLTYVFNKHVESLIYFIDDKEEILRLAKGIHPELKLFLIKRTKEDILSNKSSENMPIISSLNDLSSLFSI